VTVLNNIYLGFIIWFWRNSSVFKQEWNWKTRSCGFKKVFTKSLFFKSIKWLWCCNNWTGERRCPVWLRNKTF